MIARIAERATSRAVESHDERPVPPLVDHDAEGTLATCGALKDYWTVACLSRDLRARPIARTIFGTRIALYRDREGRAHAVLDRCLHRAGALSDGVVVDGKLACAYHGWTYDASGAVVHVPSLGPEQRGPNHEGAPRGRLHIADTPRTAGCVKVFPVLEQDGLVFVLPSGDTRTLRRDAVRVPYAEDPEWVSYWMVTRFTSGVTHLVENFVDVPHTAFVHRGWFRSPARRRIPALVELTADQRVRVTYQEPGDRIVGLGRVLHPPGAQTTHTDEFIAPSTTIVDYHFGDRGGVMLNSHVTPVGPRESMVYTAFAFRAPLGRFVSRLLRPIIRAYTQHLIGQDVDMLRVQERGLAADAHEPRFHNTSADLPHHYTEELRAWLTRGAVDEAPAPERTMVEMWI